MMARRRSRGARDTWADLAIVGGVIVLALLPYLLGLVSTGVIGYNSGLATVPIGPWYGAHPGLPWLDPNVGYVSQALGHLAALNLLHGHLPWWNPYEAVGVPLAGEGQSAALFPLTPLLIFAKGQLYFHLALQLIAAYATLRLLKELGMDRWVCIVGAILFGLNGTFAWLTNAPFNPVCFLPVILWGVERCRTRSLTEGWSGWLLIAAGLSLSVYAGFPETAYIDGILAACWAVLRLVQAPPDRRLGFAATIGFGSAVGLAVSAPFFAAFSSATHKADIGGHAGVFATAHLPVQAASTLGLPYLYGPLFGYNATAHHVSLTSLWGTVGGFVTAAVVATAFLGLLIGRNLGLRILLAAWIAVTLAKSFGVGPVVHVVNLIPGISPIAFGRYAPPSWEMAFIVLAAMGLQGVGDITVSPRRRRRALALAGACSVAAVGLELFAGAGLLQVLGKNESFTGVAAAAEVWALCSVVLLVVIGMVAEPAIAQLAMGAVLVGEALIMFMTPELSAPKSIPLDVKPVVFLQHHLGLNRFVTLGPIVPNYGSYFGIAEANAHDLPIPGPWANFVHQHLEPNERPQQFNGVSSLNPRERTPVEELERNLTAYEAIGVKYVLAPSQWVALPGHVVFRDKYTHIWELPTPAPFYWVLSGSCSIHGISVDQVVATCSKPSEVVRSELDDPGWTATANGAPVAVIPTGPLFGMVRLPAGTSDVTFTYQPPRLALCETLCVVGVTAGVAASFVPVAVRRGRRRSRGRHAAGRARGPMATRPLHGELHAASPGLALVANGSANGVPVATPVPGNGTARRADPVTAPVPVTANGHANGHTNGHANGHANGADRVATPGAVPLRQR